MVMQIPVILYSSLNAMLTRYVLSVDLWSDLHVYRCDIPEVYRIFGRFSIHVNF